MKLKLFSVLVICIALVACSKIQVEDLASITKASSVLVEGYEDRATALKTMHEVIITKCNAGQLTPTVCNKLKDTYNETRAAFITQGDELIKKIEGKPNKYDEATKQADMKYEALRRLYLEVR